MAPRSPLHHPDCDTGSAQREAITLRAGGSTQSIDALVLSKRADRIQIMLNEGSHSVFCELKPTPDGLAYAGISLGREIVYERTRAQVEADVAERGPAESESPAW